MNKGAVIPNGEILVERKALLNTRLGHYKTKNLIGRVSWKRVDHAGRFQEIRISQVILSQA
jgi:hypothetical protein